MGARSVPMLAALLMCLPSCRNDRAPGPADLVVVNARIWTATPDSPWAEAMAVDGDTILAVGTNEDIHALIGRRSRVIDAAGAMVTPGFIDSHVHLLSGGYRLAAVQLRDADSPRRFVERIRDFAAGAEPGTWITGGDWDHEQWGGSLPDRAWIDSVTAGHPVWVNRLDGHMALANTLALRAAGIDPDTRDVPGGEIVRRSDGSPTGVLKDNAMALVDRVVKEPRDSEKDAALDAAMRYLAGHGVTSVHDMGGEVGEIETLVRAREADRMITRVYAAYPLASWRELSDRIREDGTGDAWLRFGGLKGFVDGSLGSHTAAFLEDYADAPGERGLVVNSEDTLRSWILAADSAGLHVMVHAIGDRAIRSLLDLYKEAETAHGGRDRRFRIEHAQHIAPADVYRFANLGVIASMQPYHAIDDGRWADRVIGAERSRTTYAFRSLLDSGAVLAFGSDWFVAPPTPLEGIYAAVTRRTLDGAHPSGWVPEQKISVEEALRAYTIDAAYAAFEDAIKGSLEPGKLADFVLIDQDLSAIAPETIPDARILLTVTGGEIVYEAPR